MSLTLSMQRSKALAHNNKQFDIRQKASAAVNRRLLQSFHAATQSADFLVPSSLASSTNLAWYTLCLSASFADVT